MNERLIHLRIKIKSLADEAVTIRKEAKKVQGMVKWGLNHHRTSVVRPYSRSNLLAYGYLRGVPYRVMEKKCYSVPNFKEVAKIVRNFSPPDCSENIGAEKEAQLTAWVEEAKAYLKEQK